MCILYITFLAWEDVLGMVERNGGLSCTLFFPCSSLSYLYVYLEAIEANVQRSHEGFYFDHKKIKHQCRKKKILQDEIKLVTWSVTTQRSRLDPHCEARLKLFRNEGKTGERQMAAFVIWFFLGVLLEFPASRSLSAVVLRLTQK